MKWKTYSKMSVEDKEYWKFHFEKDDYPIRPSIGIITIMWSFIGIACAIYLLGLKEIGTFHVGTQLLSSALLITHIIALVWVIDLVASIIITTYQYCKEYRWLKKQGYK